MMDFIYKILNALFQNEIYNHRKLKVYLLNYADDAIFYNLEKSYEFSIPMTWKVSRIIEQRLFFITRIPVENILLLYRGRILDRNSVLPVEAFAPLEQERIRNNTKKSVSCKNGEGIDEDIKLENYEDYLPKLFLAIKPSADSADLNKVRRHSSAEAEAALQAELEYAQKKANLDTCEANRGSLSPNSLKVSSMKSPMPRKAEVIFELDTGLIYDCTVVLLF
jgi:hypothetical protein